MPLLVLLLALRPVRLASPVRAEVQALGLVDVVVVHAPLDKDILTPRAILPIATLVGARGEDSMAILQVRGQNRRRGAAHHLQITKESVLHVTAILEVKPVRGVPSPVAKPLPQALRHKDSVCVRLDHVFAHSPPADLADLHPDLVEHTPIHPRSRLFALELVELSERVLHLNHAVAIEIISHVAEDVPSLTREDADAIFLLKCQQLELTALFGAASVFRVCSKAIQLLTTQLAGDWDGVGTDDAARKALQARRARLIALS